MGVPKGLKAAAGEGRPIEYEVERKAFKRMLWNTRFTNLRTIAAAIAAILLAGLLYMMAVSAYYNISGKSADFDRFVATLVETHETGLRVDQTTYPVSATITPWLTQRTKLKLFRQVGSWEAAAGEVLASKGLFGSVRYELRLSSPLSLAGESFSFLVPNELHGNRAAAPASHDSAPVWDQLSHIGDGYVAEMAFALRGGMKPEELFKMVDGVGVRLLNMPVYAGELKEITELSYSSSGGDYWLPHLNLRPYKTYYKGGSNSVKWLGDEAILQRSAEQMLLDLEWLTAKAPYEDREIDKQRLKYLRTNGVTVYGAVVTGPVRELEKLRTFAEFHHFQLGRIEVWNWR